MSLAGRAALLAGLVACGLAAGPPCQAETIKPATLIPQGSFWDRALRDMGATWQAETDDQVQLRIYAGGIAEMDLRGLGVVRILGSDEETSWHASTLEFAESIRDAFVPTEFYDRAVAVRDAYRRAQQ